MGNGNTVHAPDEWDEWLRDWTYSIQAQHRPETIKVYLRGLRQFRAHLGATHPEIAARTSSSSPRRRRPC